MNKITTIAKREFFNRLRSPSYVLTTLFAPIIFVVPLIALMIWQGQQVPRNEVLIVDPAGLFAEERDEFSHGGLLFTITEGPLAEAREELPSSESLLGILHAPSRQLSDLEYIVHDRPTPAEQYAGVLSYLRGFGHRAQLAGAPAPPEVQPTVTILNPRDGGIKLAAASIAYVLGLVLYLMMIIYTNSLMKGVIEEKQNRIVEVVNMIVKPRQLMFGKIYGIGLAGFLQLVLIVAFSTGLFFAVRALAVSYLGVELATGAEGGDTISFGTIVRNYRLLPMTKILVAVPLFFIAGFLMNGALTAAIAATTNDDGDNSLSFLSNVTNILAIYIAMIAVMMPDSALAQVAMYIPFLAPVVTPALIPFDVPWYQIVISLAIVCASFLGIASLAGRVYRISMLTYGQRIGLPQVIAMLRNR